MNKMKMLALAVFFASIPEVSEADDYKKIAHDFMTQTKAECDEYGPIVAEAKWSKWQKSPNFTPEKFGKDAYALVVKMQIQQCISTKLVSAYRDMKSQITSKEAIDLRLDDKISEQMAIIEKTL